jgi:hypothetical protein
VVVVIVTIASTTRSATAATIAAAAEETWIAEACIGREGKAAEAWSKAAATEATSEAASAA